MIRRAVPVILLCALALPAGAGPAFPYVPSCLPPGVAPFEHWEFLGMQRLPDPSPRVWLEAFYRTSRGSLRTLWLDRIVALVDPDPRGPTPAWIDADAARIREDGRVEAVAQPRQGCRWVTADGNET